MKQTAYSKSVITYGSDYRWADPATEAISALGGLLDCTSSKKIPSTFKELIKFAPSKPARETLQDKRKPTMLLSRLGYSSLARKATHTHTPWRGRGQVRQKDMSIK